MEKLKIQKILKGLKLNSKNIEELSISYLNKDKKRPKFLYFNPDEGFEKEPICYTKITIYLKYSSK